MKTTSRPAGHAWIRAWLEQMMAKHDLSARAWAGKTGDGAAGPLASTTITRFLATNENPPSLKVLRRLASAIAETVPLAPGQVVGFVDVPLISPTLILRVGSVREAMSMADGVISVPERFSGCAAVVVSSDSATLAGVMPGDTVIFDPEEMPKDGQLLVVALPDGGVGVLRTQGGLLHRQAPSLEPPLEPATVHVLGVAKHVQRDLA